MKTKNCHRFSFLKIPLFSILLFSFQLNFAQIQLVGDATFSSSDCIRLTDNKDGQEGAAWMPDKIDLRESFEIIADLKIGCSNGGADGMTFAFQPFSNSLGYGGGGLGYGAISPSLAVEFDAFKNNDFGDPGFDHIAIITQGDMSHNSLNNLAGPVQAHLSKSNIEDCEFHEMRVVWDAGAQFLEVFFDCESRLKYQGDIVNNIFFGDPFVFWGFTAGTGAKNNEHIVCRPELTHLDTLLDAQLCPGGQIQLEAEGGVMYQWSPAASLTNPNIANPIAAPTETTTYFLEITGECGQKFLDTLTVFVEGDSVFFDIGADTTLCLGEPLTLDATTENASYLWSNTSTQSSIQPNTSGTYAVTVTVNDFCEATDQIQVHFIILPVLDFSQFNSICPNETILLDATFPDASYLWQDGSTDPIFEVNTPGDYAVTLEHFCGNRSGKVNIIAEESCLDAYIPNAFSPNGDGFNDAFFIQDGGDISIINQLLIFNRWGDLIFEASDILPNDPRTAWDGTFNGEKMTSGVYTYFANITFRNGVQVQRAGDLLLMR